jgi:hypothetical protein
MSDRDLVIERCAELEGILKQKFRAEGRGLVQQAISIEHLLPPELMQNLRWIGRIRNECAHEVHFQLRDRDRYIRTCDQVKAALMALDASHSPWQAVTSEGNTTFRITGNLATFQIQPLPFPGGIKLPSLISSTIQFESFTGRIIDFKEKTEITESGKSKIKSLHQKIWMRLENGSEKFIEVVDHSLQARKGHQLTVLVGRRGGRSAYVAFYIHDLGTYFYNQGEWKKLLFFFGRMPLFWLFLLFPVTLPGAINYFFRLPESMMSLISTTIWVYFILCAFSRPINMGKFKAHIGNIIANH